MTAQLLPKDAAKKSKPSGWSSAGSVPKGQERHRNHDDATVASVGHIALARPPPFNNGNSSAIRMAVR